MPNKLLPVVFMLSSTASLSVTGLLTKYLTTVVPISLLSFLRFAVPALILLAFLAVSRFRIPERAMLKPLAVRAVCLAACQVCFIYSLQHLSLVEGVVLFSTGPLFIPLLEKLIFGVRMPWVTVVGLIATFTGVVMLSGDVTQMEWRPELLAGLFAGLFNAGSQLSLYKASKSSLRSVEINVWSFTMAAVMLFPMLTLVPWHSALDLSMDRHLLLTIATLVVVSLLVINTQVFRAKAYRLAESGSQLAPLIFTNLLFSAALQLLFFNVSYTAAQQLGLVLIVVATVSTSVLPKLWHAASHKLHSAS
ncbi:DMT family transporter [Vibrio fluvialis]|uniref:DMT family transporter n=1 Tax=Vibrio fluvialis TaxID=676 RepID=UPI001EEA75ED|nr:DMT family transporter [Vibrio fluvialis]EKO3981854.1 DMT family transporter [Vibrio fluvialis]MCG6383149.1 DMT family transporter [Vibrio fluvialis]